MTRSLTLRPSIKMFTAPLMLSLFALAVADQLHTALVLPLS